MARYKRGQGFEVHFSTGTDEHGQKIQRYAQRAGKSPQEFVDQSSAYFKELCHKLNIVYDDFIRTTQPRHIKTVQSILQKIYQKGDIYKGSYQGLYCVDCETYYLGKDAPGGKCPIHEKELEYITEQTYFFRLGQYQAAIKKHIEGNESFILPSAKRKEVLTRLQEPLKDLSISRKTVSWGIPLPFDPEFTCYVWVEALMNYLTTLDYPGEKFKKFWPTFHLIGKDIVWHHSVIWGGLLLALGLELPAGIFSHGFVTVNGQKMSKSLGNVIDPILLADKYGQDALRYFLLREIPSAEDGDFNEQRFKERYNSDLSSGIGNLTARILQLAEKLEDKLEYSELDPQLQAALANASKIYR
ncbi:MAG: class I tRNA ligase family protein, partial [Candidatus Paceibacteria bacterium]